MKPVTDYKAYYAAQLEEALEFQDYVLTLFNRTGLCVTQFSSRRYQNEHGESSGGIEVKFDKMRVKTGNVYIETAEKSHPDNPRFVPSGIYRADNSWLYAIGDFEVVYVLPKTLLQLLHVSRRYAEKGIPTSRGFLMPERDAGKFSAKVFRGSL